MYYPIIDKLKEIMTDITSIKDKQPLIIEGTLTGPSQTEGTWIGNYSDVRSSFGNKPVYFKIVMPSGDKYFIPITLINETNAMSCLISIANSPAAGVIYPDNTFHILIL